MIEENMSGTYTEFFKPFRGDEALSWVASEPESGDRDPDKLWERSVSTEEVSDDRVSCRESDGMSNKTILIEVDREKHPCQESLLSRLIPNPLSNEIYPRRKPPGWS